MAVRGAAPKNQIAEATSGLTPACCNSGAGNIRAEAAYSSCLNAVTGSWLTSVAFNSRTSITNTTETKTMLNKVPPSTIAIRIAAYSRI